MTERIALFIDGANVYAAARRLGRDLERSEERLAELTRTLGEAGRVW